MESITSIDSFFMPLFLFGLIFCGISILKYTSKHRFPSTKRSELTSREQSSIERNEKSCLLACLLEDIPPNALTGQACKLATPLMTPFACLWEDIPKTALRGQAYELASSLMTPLACLLEDVPAAALIGQAYRLATPLMSPLACISAQGWHQFYRQRLGKPGINYWEWRDKPESITLCSALSELLKLPEPRGYAKEILESLGEKHHLFSIPTSLEKIDREGNIFTHSQDYGKRGKFAHRDLKIQTKMRLAFQQWHNNALRLIGRDVLEAVYQICYGTIWERVQQIAHGEPEPQEPPSKLINEPFRDESAPWWKVLGVRSSANALQVENAYKKLIRFWHPDLNKHPHATQVTSRINVAYQQYRSRDQTNVFQEKPFSKVRDWFKPLFSR
jgi:hypothetical protein